jgi:hypothetical protein
MNIVGLFAGITSVAVFWLTYRTLFVRPLRVQLACFGAFGLLAIPSILFAAYYLHVLPETAWFYALHAWPEAEWLIVFLGAFMAAGAALMPRKFLCGPLFVLLVVGLVPFIKPMIAPIADAQFQEQWKGNVCSQSTPSTCGPASVCTIIKWLGGDASERVVARAAYSYSGGTEAWYLARYVRSRGFEAHFDFRKSFSPEVGLPAVVGVRMGGYGHFIAVLEAQGESVTIGDPLGHEERLSFEEFHRRYVFTGFHMPISK